MLDLETMGTKSPYSVITQIGACYFDPRTSEIGKTFLMNISMTDSLRNGFEVDSGAMHFWFGQPPKARTFLQEPRHPVEHVLSELAWFGKQAKVVWSHATFDFVLVTNYYEKMGKKPAFHYSYARDIRTIVHLAGLQKDDDMPRDDAHDALKDCIYQVGYVSKGYQKLLRVKS